MLVRTSTSSVRAGRARRRQGNAQGFTVMETAVALLVMMVVGLGATSLFFYAIRYNSGAAERSMALAVAQQQLEELRAVPWDDPLLTATQNSAICTTTAPCYSGSRAFTATKTITNTTTTPGVAGPTMKTITIMVTPLRGNTPWADGTINVTAQRATLLRGPN